MQKNKPWLLVAVILSLFLAGCGKGNDATDNRSKVGNQVVVNMEFAATYLQTIGTGQAMPSLTHSQRPPVNERNTAVGYNGRLEVVNTMSGDIRLLDWPVAMEAGGSIVSHRALAMRAGIYNLTLILANNEHQYVAKAQGLEVTEGETPEIDFVLEPSLGKNIIDFDELQSVSTLTLGLLPEEFAGLQQPRFGLSINGDAEQVFSINKETGVAQILLNVAPGKYQLSLHLYDGDVMVAKSNGIDTFFNLKEGKNVPLALAPLKADVNISLQEIYGTLSFTIPAEIVREVGSSQNLALIVRLAGGNIPAQEKILTVREEGAGYKASELFELGRQGQVDAYLAFHKVSEVSEHFSRLPLATCNTSINVKQSRVPSCHLGLKRKSLVSDSALGALRLSVIDQDFQPAAGVTVYVGDRLVGLTGVKYSKGALMTTLIAGEHQIKAAEGVWVAAGSIVMKPLNVVNKVLFLRRRADVG